MQQVTACKVWQERSLEILETYLEFDSESTGLCSGLHESVRTCSVETPFAKNKNVGIVVYLFQDIGLPALCNNNTMHYSIYYVYH